MAVPVPEKAAFQSLNSVSQFPHLSIKIRSIDILPNLCIAYKLHEILASFIYTTKKVNIYDMLLSQFLGHSYVSCTCRTQST